MNPIIIYIMGVSGSGKTTIGKKLSARIGIPFFDGDDFHSAANIEKMAAGYPLNDEDRAEWLSTLNAIAREQTSSKGAIIGCSALKEKYRAILSSGINVPSVWIFLQGSHELIRKRMQARTDHFMPPDLLTSQFDALEIPGQAITIDIRADPDTLVDQIIAHLPAQTGTH